ncbi:MAG: hypothetical protein ABWY58_07790 [Aeromicrobium sp.]
MTSRDDVLAAAGVLRTTDPSAQAERALDSAIRRIVADVISVDTSAGDLLDCIAYPTATDGTIDGVMIDATTYAYASGVTRTRSVIALVPTDETASLRGSIELHASGATLHTSRLSGGLFVSPAIDTTDAGPLAVMVTDDVTEPPAAQPAPAAPVPRTAGEKAAAKKAHDAALKKARKKYAKAKKKAGTSKRKKTSAKKKYARSRAAAKARYRAAVADVAPPATSVPTDQRVFRPAISTDTGWAAVA